MATKNTINYKGILEKIIYFAIVGISIGLLGTYIQTKKIPDLKASISRCWGKYGDMDKRLDGFSCEENSRAINELREEIRTLRERHMQ